MRHIKKAIEPFLDRFKNQEGYFTGDRMRHNYFFHHPQNDTLEEIKLKVSAIEDDEIHRHGMVEVVAHQILRLDQIDDRLKAGDFKLIPEINQIQHNGQKLDLYSFATRYCNGHNETAFPIYERNINSLLQHYLEHKNGSKTTTFTHYPSFVSVLDGFVEDMGIHDLNYQEIDKFLWIYGEQILLNLGKY